MFMSGQNTLKARAHCLHLLFTLRYYTRIDKMKAIHYLLTIKYKIQET